VHDVDLESGYEPIAGTVVDADGEPVRGARVYASSEATGRSFSSNTRTDREGRFSLVVRPGSTYAVSSLRETSSVVERGVAAGTTELLLELPRLGRIALRVVDQASGAPVQPFDLWWRAPDAGATDFTVRSDLAPGGDGVFVAELPEGELELRVSALAQGYPALDLHAVPCHPEPAGPLLVRLPRGARLALHFVADDEQQRDARVLWGTALLDLDQLQEVSNGGNRGNWLVWRHGRIRPDSEGRANLDALAPGTYVLHKASGPPLRFDPPRIEIQAGVREQAIEVHWRPADSAEPAEPR
jgi:hypothetical protein